MPELPAAENTHTYAEGVGLYRLFSPPPRLRAVEALVTRDGRGVTPAVLTEEIGASEATVRECLAVLGAVRVATESGGEWALNTDYDADTYDEDVPDALRRAHESLVSLGDSAPFDELFTPDSRLRVYAALLGKHYASLTAEELADMTGLHRSTVYSQLGVLTDVGVVNSTEAPARHESDVLVTPPANTACYRVDAELVANTAFVTANHGIHRNRAALDAAESRLPM